MKCWNWRIRTGLWCPHPQIKDQSSKYTKKHPVLLESTTNEDGLAPYSYAKFERSVDKATPAGDFGWAVSAVLYPENKEREAESCEPKITIGIH